MPYHLATPHCNNIRNHNIGIWVSVKGVGRFFLRRVWEWGEGVQEKTAFFDYSDCTSFYPTLVVVMVKKCRKLPKHSGVFAFTPSK